MKRKIYQKMLEWKKGSNGRTALMIDGARRVGKSYIAEEFARNEYSSYLLIDFSNASAKVKRCFNEYLDDLDTLLMLLESACHVELTKGESVIIFDEVQRFPRAREAIKHLVKDGRYHHIETGSQISMQKNVKKILIPSEERHLEMFPMDFEEFLWTTGDVGALDVLRLHMKKRKPLGEDLHLHFLDLYRQHLDFKRRTERIEAGGYVDIMPIGRQKLSCTPEATIDDPVDRTDSFVAEPRVIRMQRADHIDELPLRQLKYGHVEVVGERHVVEYLAGSSPRLHRGRTHAERLAVGGDAAHHEVVGLEFVVRETTVGQLFGGGVPGAFAFVPHKIHHHVVRRRIGRPCRQLYGNGGVGEYVPRPAFVRLPVEPVRAVAHQSVHVSVGVRDVRRADGGAVRLYVHRHDRSLRQRVVHRHAPCCGALTEGENRHLRCGGQRGCRQKHGNDCQFCFHVCRA